MLASLGEVAQVSASDTPQTNADRSDDAITAAEKEPKADEANAAMTTSIPNSNANKPPDLADEVRAPTPARDGMVGVEAGQGDDSSGPG